MHPLLLILLSSAAMGLCVFLLAVWAGSAVTMATARSGVPDAVVSERRSVRRKKLSNESHMMCAGMWMVGQFALLFRGPRFTVMRAYFAKPYSEAGYPGGFDEAELLAITAMLSALLCTLLGLVGLMITPTGLLLGVLGLPLAVLYIISSLRTRGEFRRRQVEIMLPYAVDLLVLVLRAGANVGIAVERVVHDYEHHPIGEEFGQVLAEIQLGSNRQEAFSRLAERLDLDDVRQLVENLTQSEELGWPLADTLSAYSDRLVKQRVIKAEEYAGTASVLVMLPSTLVLAAVILVLFGPLIVRALRGELSLG